MHSHAEAWERDELTNLLPPFPLICFFPRPECPDNICRYHGDINNTTYHIKARTCIFPFYLRHRYRLLGMRTNGSAG